MAFPFRADSEETDRLLALSDGVIAIAITLLVLEITVPTNLPENTMDALETILREQGYEFFGYVLSFLVIGMYWVLHRRIFIHIDRHDKVVVWLNLVFLLLIAFVPYATNVFSRNQGQLGVVVLAGVLALTGFSIFFLWAYASKKRLIEEGLTSTIVAIQAARFLASPLVFVASIVVSIYDPTWAIATWFALVPINGVFQSKLLESIEASLQEDSNSRVR